MLNNSKLVQYVGNKPQKRDTVCGSGHIWAPGEVIEVEISIANRLLRFADVWQEHREGGLSDVAPKAPAAAATGAKKSGGKKAASKKPAAKPEQTEGDEVGEDEINAMDADQLRELVAAADLAVEFEDGEAVESMRAKVIAAASAE